MIKIGILDFFPLLSFGDEAGSFFIAQEIIKVSAPSEEEEKINRRVRRDRRASFW
jgi:hypothetical protein